MSFIQSIRRMLYKYGTSSVPSYQDCCCRKTLKNNNSVRGYTQRNRNGNKRSRRNRNKKRSRRNRK